MTISMILAAAYVLFNSACLIAYVPQVMQLIRCSQSRQHVVLSMWGMWTVGALIELMYAFDIDNSPWMWMAGGHLVACVTVTVFGAAGWMEKRQHPEQENEQAPAR